MCSGLPARVLQTSAVCLHGEAACDSIGEVCGVQCGSAGLDFGAHGILLCDAGVSLLLSLLNLLLHRAGALGLEGGLVNTGLWLRRG